MQAFLLAKKNYRENDQMATFYTKDLGKVELVARGVKKIVSKNAPLLEPFSLLDIEIVGGKKYSYVTKVQTIESFSTIWKDLGKMTVGTMASKYLDQIIKNGERDIRIFSLLNSLYKFLDNQKSVSEISGLQFLGRVACIFGYEPTLKKCVICKKKTFTKVMFSNSDGGIVCLTCSRDKNISGHIISNEGLKKLDFLIFGTKDAAQVKFSKREVSLFKDIIFGYSAYHFGVRPGYIKF